MNYEEILERLELISIRFETYNDYPKSATNNAKKVIRWKEEHGDEVKGMTRTGWTRAAQLARKAKISRDTIARMASFKRHQKNAVSKDASIPKTLLKTRTTLPSTTANVLDKLFTSFSVSINN